MKTISTVMIAVMMVSLTACQSTQGKEKETVGTLLGAGLGALVGSRFGGGKGALAATAVGALAGAYFGGQFGKSLDQADRQAHQQTAQDALEYNNTNQTSTWKNPDSKAEGEFTPTRTYQTAEGNFCREFETTILVDGKTENASGTACRQPDGSWRVIN